MELRDHPLLMHHGVPAWPPVWVQIKRQGERKLRGEVGFLSEVQLSPVTYARCFLTMEYEGDRFLGILIVDDSAFCRQICTFLNLHIGASIREIGDLDVSFTLSLTTQPRWQTSEIQNSRISR